MVDLRALLSELRRGTMNPAVRFLFALRWRLGRIFGWDRKPARAAGDSFMGRLTAADHAASLVRPGSPDGPFRALFVSSGESISEIQNATVHGFSVFALAPRPSGHRLYWGVYVRPVGRLTAWYMCLIDPFRRFVVYPSILRSIRAAWNRSLVALMLVVAGACTERPPEYVYLRTEAVAVTVTARSAPRVRVGEWLPLSASRSARGEWQKVRFIDVPQGTSWIGYVPPEHEDEVAANLRWFADPMDGVEFDAVPPKPVPIEQRAVRFSKPGAYRLWATSHSPLDATSNTLEIEAVAVE